ncbi:acyltransferase-domain-containing protein [Coprinopsis marcescibilis]|uniref:Acyltransferase-domain-containing protein n=1 Tax=Coprinopsis marcescibilis TaxID=230819 RepID=A0A5C3KT84_COPMA|nr:acyltransferase-domain-containing protein [Coprinopsis marcescibilis]
MSTPVGSPTPWSYVLIRLLFRFVLKIFYGSIVIENTEFVPETGKPCIVCANHSNSLTDALMLITSVPPQKRNMLRMTAKASIFGQRNFTSWLIESTGTVPIQRRKDNADGTADNTQVMLKLMEAVEMGDAVCMFPEGISRFHPEIAPLKTGVARMVTDILGRNRDNPDFEISVLPCAITYMHRQHFRSDVLVTFQKPLVFSPKTHPELVPPVDFADVKRVTQDLQESISSGLLDAPKWELIRSAKLAAGMYAPLGTRMPLGEYVRLARKFLELFKSCQTDGIDVDTSASVDPPAVRELCRDLKAYQDQLARWGVKDDRIRRPPLRRPVILFRMSIRLTWLIILLTTSLPGLILWAPVFLTTYIAVRSFKKTGPVLDTWDEIAQYKLIYGLLSGGVVWALVVIFTWPIAFITIPLTPAMMWITLRWFEDTVSTFRAFTALYRLLQIGKPALKRMREQRIDLHSRVANLAMNVLGLPAEPEKHFAKIGGREKGRITGDWDERARYFSIKRRRKRDWNEVLRLYDKVDYPVEDN